MLLDGVSSPGPALPTSVRSMEDMLGSLHPGAADSAGIRAGDGWRHCLLGGSAFRHDYDADVARGGWEFYQLGQGLCLAIVDMVATRVIPRRHCLADQLVLSAVLEGNVPIANAHGEAGQLANGYCTIYGMDTGAEMHTLYVPGRTLKWVSVFIERQSFFTATGLQPQDLPERIARYVQRGIGLPHENVPLSHAASLVMTQIAECSFQNSFRRAFLAAKARELACQILFMLSHDVEKEELEHVSFTAGDQGKLRRAMQLIECALEEPPNIAGLAADVGLTRQKLQLGFRLVYGDTVARIRDRRRMEHALRLVRTSAVPIIDVALETGYEHPASFTRAFKAAYGVSPMRMRRMAQNSALLMHVAESHS